MAFMYGKGIIAVPKLLRQAARLEPGHAIRMSVQNGKLVVEPDEDDWLEELKQLRKENATASGKEVEEEIKAAREERKARWLHVP